MTRRAALLLASLLACSSADVEPPPTTTTTTVAVERAVGDAVRGRQIYAEGTSPDGGKIEAVLAGDVVADAKTMPCIGCHGEDGRGRPEGGMTPSNITWEALSKPYGGRGIDGRAHAAYDVAAVRKAITLGVDPSGNDLQRSMPRYRMSARDLDDLAAYLQVLGEPWAIGVSDASIALLCLLMPGDPTADAIAALLAAYLEEVNQRGGVFGRKLELEVLRLADDERPESLEDKLYAHPPFAVLAPRLGEDDSDLLALLDRESVLVIGPGSMFPPPDPALRRFIFHVDGGIPAQALALAEFSTREPGVAVVVHEDSEAQTKLAERVLATWRTAGLESHDLAVAEQEDVAAVWARLDPLDADILLWLGPARAVVPTLEHLAAGDRDVPRVLLPGAIGFGDPFALPSDFDGRVWLAYPWVPEDLSAVAMRDYEDLVEKHGLAKSSRHAQLAALNAAMILIEGLSRSGRGVTRGSFIDTLERLQDYRTGLGPPISYGPNRRIGQQGARIVKVELAAGRLALVEPP